MTKYAAWFFICAGLLFDANRLFGFCAQDSTRLDVAQGNPDSLSVRSPRDSVRTGHLDSLVTKHGWHAGSAQTGNRIHQDALQLVESVLPVLPVHHGEFGLPSFLGAGGLPPRLIDVFVNGIRWLPGVYGVVDATGIPETLAEEIVLQSRPHDFASTMQQGALAFSYSPRSFDFRTPMSALGFVRGPFGGDAIRATLARRLSSKMQLRFSLEETNSGGQFAELPYDGQKISTALSYKASKSLHVGYQYFDTRNESGILFPFYQDVRGGDSAGFGKEQRIYHGMELSLPAIFVRPFYWNLRQEFRSNAMRIRHRSERIGIEGGWRKHWQHWRSTLRVTFADDRLASNLISLSRSQSYRMQGELDWVPGDKLLAGAGVTLHHEDDWPAGVDLDLNFGLSLTNTLQTRAVLNRRAIQPAPAEYANTIGILRSNHALEAAELRRGAVTLCWQPSPQRLMQIEIALNRLDKPFVVAEFPEADSLSLFNGSSEEVPSLDFLVDWQLSRKFILGANGSLMLQDVAALYWYENVPRRFARGYLEFQQGFFDGDLAVRLRAAVRFYGTSFALNDAPTTPPAFLDVTGANLFDVQLAVRHRNISFYFSFENIFNKKFEWCPGIATPGYFLKWGAHVDLRN